ncbi:GAF domain-containing protein [Algoriphagus namhaensis]|uniref:GAF domain-containing protein n=1 Tax=Algoriphagus namhaensis TaxID=915353 RepID=A0ABV8AQP7_9BACT
MSDSLYVPQTTSRTEIYEVILPQIEALISSEPDLYANLANISAALKEAFGFFWVGFYLVKGEQLVLGPFQGPIACTRINKGKGVCGTSWEKSQTLIVPDVDAFPGHIACSSASRSEIVVPVFKGKEVFGVLDIDSESLSDFDEVDQKYLEKLVSLLGKTL